MERVVLVVGLAVLAAVVAWLIQRGNRSDPPTQGNYTVPAQLDRTDFSRPDAPWLVVVFSSATCLSCRGTWEKARQLSSGEVAVQDVEASAHRALHQRYRIDGVPLVVVADAAGVVRASFLGEPTATDLWAAVAELRAPGSTPTSCDHGVTAPPQG